MNMPRITIVFASLLILLGLFGYFVWGDQQSWTALIPSFAGLLFLITGLIALKDRCRKHAMHIAAVLSLLLIAGTFRSLPKFLQLMQGEDVARPLAVKVQSISFILTLVFLILCIRSFVLARSAQKLQ